MANWNVGRIRLKLAHFVILSLMLMIALGSAITPQASAATPQSGTDGPLYLLCDNAYMYNVPEGTYRRTVHAGYRFREHARTYYNGRYWSYGHSGEAPEIDGWILTYHLC